MFQSCFAYKIEIYQNAVCEKDKYLSQEYYMYFMI